MSGVFTIVEGRAEVKAWLRSAPARIDDWLYELSDSVVFHAHDALRETSPGRIKFLVEADPVKEDAPHLFEGSAGVTPEGRALPGPGSAREDFPYYVDQGTGLYGALHSIIHPLHGNLMGPILYRGRSIYVKSFEGQKPQHYGRQAYEETVAWMPGRLEVAKATLYAETKTEAAGRA